MLDLRLSDLVTAVRKMAANDPDHRYMAPLSAFDGPSDPAYVTWVQDVGFQGGCSYVYGSEWGNIVEVGCIVGQAAIEIGIAPADLEANEGQAGSGFAAAVFDLDLQDVQVSQEGRWLDIVQTEQDQGSTWEQAVREGDAQRPLRG